MAKKTTKTPQSPGHGVIVLAENGDVIRYDPTGLVIRLSDRVIDDIAMRLPEQGVAASPSASTDWADADTYLEGVDAWDVRQSGEWLHFTAHLSGRQGIRGFRRLVEGGAIVADAPGHVYGILGLGGARAALANQHGPDFPQHVLAPADDIGAVGHAGVDKAGQFDTLEHIREMTHEALVADTLLSWQMERFDAMPLFMTRVETDQSTTLADLRRGQAVENLLQAASNLALSALRLGKKPRLMCVSLDFALEDTISTAATYRDDMLALMDHIEQRLGRLGFDNPVFVARLESGTPEQTTSAAIEGQWELAWNHGDHRFIYSAPGYMFSLDEFDRPTEAARREMAEMTAAAVSEAETWRCPTFYLAERTSDALVIRVTARALSDLVIDPDDPLGAGVTAGFSLAGTSATVISVAIAPDDTQSLLITCSEAPEGDDVRLAYAYGADPRPGDYPANCGAVRDDWTLDSATGRKLHRWALPCMVPVTQGGGDVKT